MNVSNIAQSLDIIQTSRLQFAKNAKKVAYSVYQKTDVIHVMNKMDISKERKNVSKINAIENVKNV